MPHFFSFLYKIIKKKHLNFKWSNVNDNQRLTHITVDKSLLILNINFHNVYMEMSNMAQ